MAEVFNPLDKLNLGRSVAEALLEKPPVPLGAIPEFEGAGVYAIYYSGAHELYKPIAEANREVATWPIYVGKAIPSGGRKGSSLDGEGRGFALFNRLTKHKSSIADVERSGGGLHLADFSVRYLAVDEIWIPLGESLLISKFRPLWNLVVEGFGNNDPGSGRYSGMKPLWDHIHPGRAWAERCAPRVEDAAAIESRMAVYFLSQSLEI